MNPTDLQTFNQAVVTAQSGQTQAAHATLTGLSQRYPTDTNVLLWLAFTANNWHTASAYVEKVAQFEPNNPSLAGARTWLASQKPVAAPPPPPIAAPAFELSGATPGNNLYGNLSSYDVFPGVTMPSQTYSTTNTSIYEGNKDNKTIKSKRPWLFIIAAFLLVLLIAGAALLVLTGSLGSAPNGTTAVSAPPNGTTDVPAPPNGHSITLDGLLDGIQNQLAQSQLSGATKQSTAAIIKSSQTAYYAVSNGKPGDLNAFYTQQLTSKGWKAANVSLPTNSLTSGQLYTKDTKFAGIVIVGPVTAQDIATGMPPEVRDKFQAGDVLVMLFEFDKNSVSGSGS